MKNTLLTFAVLALVAVGLNLAGVLPATADAAPKWQATMNSDGGSSGLALPVSQCLSSTNQTISLETQTGDMFCFRTCPTSSCTADCTKDHTANRPLTNYQTPDAGAIGYTYSVMAPFNTGPIQMGLDKCVSVMNPDGGNPAVRLFLETKNAVP